MIGCDHYHDDDAAAAEYTMNIHIHTHTHTYIYIYDILRFDAILFLGRVVPRGYSTRGRNAKRK